MEKTMKYFEEKMKNLQEEFEQFKKSHRKNPEIGGTVQIAGMEWTVLDKTDAGYLAVTEGFDRTSVKFDNNTNNWFNSELRRYLNSEFLKKIEDEIGKGVLPEFQRDLTALDGQTEFGFCKDKVSLLTVDEYRKYRTYLPNTDKWWWLVTPWSTPCNGYKNAVTVVSPSGSICRNNYVDCIGVRPFCIFPSEIFESKK